MGEASKDNNNSLCFEILLDKPDQLFKSGLLMRDIGVYVRWSMALKGSIANPNGKILFELYMCIILTWIIHNFRLIDNNMIP